MKEITEESIKKLASFKNYLKGMDYYKSGRVRSLRYTEGVFHGIVSGSRDYQVRISPEEENFSFHCNCPVNPDVFCKHAVALGLEIANNAETTVEIIEPKKKKQPDVNRLIESASSDQIKTFLRKVLQESDVHLKAFEVLISGQTGAESDLDISEIRDEIINELENFDLQDYDRFYDYREDNYGYYREEWEILYDGARGELDDLLSDYLDDEKQQLDAGNIIDAFKILLAMYEARYMFDESSIIDEVEIFPEGIGYEAEGILEKMFLAFKETVINMKIQPEAAIRIIEILFDRIAFTEDKAFYDMKDFKPILIPMIVNKDVALKMQSALDRYEINIPDSDEIQLQIARVLKDDEKWLTIAKKYYQNNPTVAEQLLHHYEKTNNDSEYLRIAGFAFQKWPDTFDEVIYNYLYPRLKSDFLAEVLIHLTLRKERIDLFRKLKDDYGQPEVDKLLAKAGKQHSKDRFYVKILTELQDFPAILSYLKENIRYESFDFIIKPILNVYPRECFNLVKRKADRYLEKNKGRDYYQTVTYWLVLLKNITESNVRDELRKYITDLLMRYNRRPALKDEFKKAGLMPDGRIK